MPGAYRHAFMRPERVQYAFKEYSLPTEELVHSGVDLDAAGAPAAANRMMTTGTDGRAEGYRAPCRATNVNAPVEQADTVPGVGTSQSTGELELKMPGGQRGEERRAGGEIGPEGEAGVAGSAGRPHRALVISFTLPASSYATVALDHLMQTQPVFR